jgi:protein-S-isoprenylcysteine O-methyltransferase Ste14
MHGNPQAFIGTAWIATVVVWLIGAFATKPTARRQPADSRLLDIGEAWMAALLLFRSRLRVGPLARRFVPNVHSLVWLGVALTIAGLVLAITARLFLGGNWSATVTIKKGHTLVRRGPYALVRHPIYSGILLAILGTALAIGEVRALVGGSLVFLILAHKINLEERFMMEQFGDSYEEYRRNVKALIPFVW